MVVMTVLVGRIGCLDRKEELEWEPGAMEDATYCILKKKITCHILCDSLCCKIASENSIVVLIILCNAEKRPLALSPNVFVKQGQFLYLRAVTSREILPINLFYISRSEWGVYSEAENAACYTIDSK